MIGYFDAGIFVILTSVAFVFLDKLCSNIDPITALFAMSGIAIIFFNLLNVKQLRSTYSACLNNKLTFLFMSSALGMDWVCLIYATYISDPFISMAALFITVGICGFVKQYITTRAISNILSIGLLITCIILLYSTYQIKMLQNVGYGLLLGALAGLTFFIYMILSEILAKRANLTSVQVLATRFWVLFIGSIFFLPFDYAYHTILENAIPLAIVSFGALIIPIFFNQQTIKKLGTIRSSILISFVPPITYLFDSWYNSKINLVNFAVCMIITTALILPKIFFREA